MNPMRLLTRLTTLALLAGSAAPATAQILPRLVERVHRAGDHLRDHLRDQASARRHSHCASCRRWIAPRCETVTERVWVPGRCERVWVPPEYREICDPWGRHQRLLVRAGYWHTIEHPGHWERRSRQIQVQGRWEYVCGY